MSVKKIETLTAKQVSKFSKYTKRWTGIGLSTKPADKLMAEAAIIQIYKIAGLNPPRIIWCGSPLENICTKIEMEQTEELGANVKTLVETNIRDKVRDNINLCVDPKIRINVGANMAASIRINVGINIRDRVRDMLGDHREIPIRDSVNASIYGQHSAVWCSYYDFFRNECKLINETDALQGLISLCKSAGWALPYEHACFISDRHNLINLDQSGRLLDNGLTLLYPDGWAIYAQHGILKTNIQ